MFSGTTKSMIVLALIGLVDSISYMAVAPSLIFYVLQVGGDKEMYGLVMSAFSFASFCGKPVYGIWVDKSGNKFRVPYIFSFAIAIGGALLYFLANAAPSTAAAVAMIFAGRLLSGLGGANQTLGYAYIACVVPQKDQTKTNTILSMMRILGMASGPAVNLLLSKIETTLTIGSFELKVDPLNSVGLLLALGNLLVATIVYLGLEEPPEKKKIPDIAGAGADATAAKSDFWGAVCCIEVMLPILILFVVNSSFQLIETALPAAAADGLGWGPVETSAVLGSTSIVIFFTMMLTIVLSGKVHDLAMVGIGNAIWILGGGGMYLFWIRDAPVYYYVLPVVVSCMGFPFIAAPNRSNFTQAVNSKPALEDSAGFMQSILSMSASVAGFMTPGFVAAYVIRSPEQVTASWDLRELTPVALYVPIMPIFVLVGLYYQYQKESKLVKPSSEDEVATETTGLVPKKDRRRSSVATINQAFSRASEVNKRVSGQMMGMTPPETVSEKETMEQLEQDRKEWVALAELDYDEDEEP